MPENKFKKFKSFFSRKKDTPDDKLEKRHQKTLQRLKEFRELKTYVGVNNDNNIELPVFDVNDDNNIQAHVVDENDDDATIVNGGEALVNGDALVDDDDAATETSDDTYVNEDEYYNAEKMYRAMKRIERSLMKELTLAANHPDYSEQKENLLEIANIHKNNYNKYKDKQLMTYNETIYGNHIKFINKQYLQEPWKVDTYWNKYYNGTNSINYSNIINQHPVAPPAQQPARGQQQ